jgi:hypothetical protein
MSTEKSTSAYLEQNLMDTPFVRVTQLYGDIDMNVLRPSNAGIYSYMTKKRKDNDNNNQIILNNPKK